MKYLLYTYIFLLTSITMLAQDYDADNVHPKVNETINKLINKQVTLNQLESERLQFEHDKYKTLKNKDTVSKNFDKLQKELDQLTMKSIAEINYSFGITSDSKRTEVYQCEIKYKLRKLKKSILIYFAKETDDKDFHFNSAKFGS